MKAPPGTRPRGLTNGRTIDVLENYYFQRVDSTYRAKTLMVGFATAASAAITRVNGLHPATTMFTRTVARRGDVILLVVPPLATDKRTAKVGW